MLEIDTVEAGSTRIGQKNRENKGIGSFLDDKKNLVSISIDNSNMTTDSWDTGRKGIRLYQPEMPRDFTICLAYQVTSWRGFGLTELFTLWEWLYPWAILDLQFENDLVIVTLRIHGKPFLATTISYVWFPLTWMHICVSLDRTSSQVVLVVDGLVQEESIGGMYITLPTNFSMTMGNSHGVYNYINLNVFSSGLSTEKMVAMTRPGTELCGAPGDYISWQEVETLEWTASEGDYTTYYDYYDYQEVRKGFLGTVKAVDGPCLKESRISMFGATTLTRSQSKNEFSHIECMQHYNKMGDRRSPR